MRYEHSLNHILLASRPVEVTMLDTKSIMKQYMSAEPLLQLQALCITVFALIMERPNIIVLTLFVFKQIRADLHISQVHVVEQLPKKRDRLICDLPLFTLWRFRGVLPLAILCRHRRDRHQL